MPRRRTRPRRSSITCNYIRECDITTSLTTYSIINLVRIRMIRIEDRRKVEESLGKTRAGYFNPADFTPTFRPAVIQGEQQSRVSLRHGCSRHYSWYNNTREWASGKCYRWEPAWALFYGLPLNGPSITLYLDGVFRPAYSSFKTLPVTATLAPLIISPFLVHCADAVNGRTRRMRFSSTRDARFPFSTRRTPRRVLSCVSRSLDAPITRLESSRKARLYRASIDRSRFPSSLLSSDYRRRRDDDVSIIVARRGALPSATRIFSLRVCTIGSPLDLI